MEEVLRINQLWERILRKEVDPVTQTFYKLEFCELLIKEFANYSDVDMEEFAKDDLLYTHLIHINNIAQLNMGLYEKLLPYVNLSEGDPFISKTLEIQNKNDELLATLRQHINKLKDIIDKKGQLEKLEADLQKIAKFSVAVDNLEKLLNEDLKQAIQDLSAMIARNSRTSEVLVSPCEIGVTSEGVFCKKTKMILEKDKIIDRVSQTDKVKYIKIFKKINIEKTMLKLSFEGNKCLEIPLITIFPQVEKKIVDLSYAITNDGILQLVLESDSKAIEINQVFNLTDSSEFIIKQLINHGS